MVVKFGLLMVDMLTSSPELAHCRGGGGGPGKGISKRGWEGSPRVGNRILNSTNIDLRKY